MAGGTSHPVCTHCGSTKSPLWRRGVHSEMLCNACGLYWKHHGTYRPLSLKVAADKKETPRTKSPVDLSLPAKRDSNLRRLKSALSSGISGAESTMAPIRCKNSAGKIALPSAYFLQTGIGRWRGEPVFAPELPPSTGTANVRLVSAEIRSAGDLDAAVIHSENTSASLPLKKDMIHARYIMFKGRLLFIGDHVAVRGDDSQVYFAIVHDFWITPTGNKFVKLQWLLPKSRHILEIDGPKERIDPGYFTLGPMHDRAEQIESIIDVFFSPQQIQRPLEGPTPPEVPTLASSRPSTPISRRSSFEIWPDKAFSMSEKHYVSDSELELGRSMDVDLGKRAVIPSVTNILDDVEMAHLLCSMT